MSITIEQGSDRIRSSGEFNKRFPDVKEVAFGKISAGILDDIGQDSEHSIDRFDERIRLLCLSGLRLPPSHVSQHLNSVRVIADRKAVARTIDHEDSPEYYLALIGLSVSSDPAKISAQLAALSKKEGPLRIAFAAAKGGIPKTDREIKEIISLIYASVPSVRALKSDRTLPKAKTDNRPRAAIGDLSFNMVLQSFRNKFKLEDGHPLLSSGVKTCVMRVATKGHQQRLAKITGIEASRINFCYLSLLFAHKNQLPIALTSVYKCVSAYILRPSLNLYTATLNKTRLDFAPKTARSAAGPFDGLASPESVAMLLGEDRGDLFGDPGLVCMAYSYLCFDLTDREIYSPDEILKASKAIVGQQLDPHSGPYVSPLIDDPLFDYWNGRNPKEATKEASRVLTNITNLLRSPEGS